MTEEEQQERIPATLEEAFEVLDEIWDEETRTTVKNMDFSEVGVSMHFGAGMWMRNTWGLWHDSALAQDLQARGCYHPDSMSSYIAEQWWQRAHGMPVQNYRAGFKDELKGLDEGGEEKAE